MHKSVKLLDIVAWNPLFVPKYNQDNRLECYQVVLIKWWTNPQHCGVKLGHVWKGTEICKQLGMYSFLTLLALCMTAPAVSL